MLNRLIFSFSFCIVISTLTYGQCDPDHKNLFGRQTDLLKVIDSFQEEPIEIYGDVIFIFPRKPVFLFKDVDGNKCLVTITTTMPKLWSKVRICAEARSFKLTGFERLILIERNWQYLDR